MKFLTIFTKVVPMLTKLKGAIFADGKFSPKRAGVVLASIILVALLSTQFSPQDIEVILEHADEVSDMIGYVE